jgi:hypothetical protein
MKPVGPPPVFKQELHNEKIKIGDKITLTCQGEDCLNQNVITESRSFPPFMEASRHHFKRNLPLDRSLTQMDPTYILALGS